MRGIRRARITAGEGRVLNPLEWGTSRKTASAARMNRACVATGGPRRALAVQRHYAKVDPDLTTFRRAAMKPSSILAATLFGAIASGATPASAWEGPAERDAANLAEYEQFAGEPIDGFHFWDIDRFVRLGKSDVVVYTEINKAFLLRVEKPCPGLDFTHGISVTSTQRRVSQRFDFVQFEGQKCAIDAILPIDVKAYKAAQRGEVTSD
jgi:hypothetical protein